MRIVVAGDFCPNNRAVPVIASRKFRIVDSCIYEAISHADYSLLNLECPIANIADQRLDKCGPNLCTTSEAIECIRSIGFNCVTLANNHFLDYGYNGVKSTISELERFGIEHVGGGLNIEAASKTLFKEIDGEIIAIVNCCEHEFSIATPQSPGSNPLNPISQFYAIEEARKKADYVLVIIHGGCEHYQLPSPRMKELYHFFIDIGADAVINHHQHCFSGYEVYHNKPIFYGLGNFFFDWENIRGSKWNKGFLVELIFSHSAISFEVYPYSQCDNEVSVSSLSFPDKESFRKELEDLSEIIKDNERLTQNYLSYLDSESISYRFALEPYHGRLLKGLYVRRLIPSFISRRKRLQMLNYIMCESHAEKLIYCLKNEK